MEPKPLIHVIATECRPEDEEKFNKWYDEIHIPMLFEFKGLKKAVRYKRVYESGQYARYLAIYEFDSKKAFEDYENSPELAAASKEEHEETWKDSKYDMVWRVQYEPIKTWERQEGGDLKVTT
jgi:uncharacterized protein (TIGR02118 family)